MTATGAIEALYTLRDIDNAITPLAPQELIDCCVLEPDDCDENGCYNYATNKAFKWIMDNGISTEEDYPFQGQKGDCKPKTKVMCIYIYIYIEAYIYICVYVHYLAS